MNLSSEFLSNVTSVTRDEVEFSAPAVVYDINSYTDRNGARGVAIWYIYQHNGKFSGKPIDNQNAAYRLTDPREKKQGYRRYIAHTLNVFGYDANVNETPETLNAKMFQLVDNAPTFYRFPVLVVVKMKNDLTGYETTRGIDTLEDTPENRAAVAALLEYLE